ncbi:MAG: acyl-CoA reductase [Alistipes sp.]
MNDVLNLFLKLDRRLESFGQDAGSKLVIAEAQAANGWFTTADICRAITAIRTQMLNRHYLETWLRTYPLPVAQSRKVLIVMAGNIPLVGFLDLLCVVASGHQCVVKLSSKDTVLMSYMIQLLKEIDMDIPIVQDVGQPVDAVIATGGERANHYFQAHYAGLPALLRNSRHAAAVLSGCETQEQLEALADDIFAYSGLGCRNVSLVFTPESYELKLHVPTCNSMYVNNYRQHKALLSMANIPFRDLGGALLVDRWDFPMALSEIAVAKYTNVEDVSDWLCAHEDELQCVVSDCVPFVRRVSFGQTQSPALTDYPDGQDVLQFLCEI